MLSKTYNPKKVEDKIYRLWEKSGFFNPDKLPGKRKKAFVVTMAPPNITGNIHVGHVLENTLSDVIVRQKRMQGERTLFLPGKDHAGIAAQYVVEKQLKKEGQNRFDLGKKRFLERMWQWMKDYGQNIDLQLKKLGLSCDWSRKRWTLDKNYQKAVKEAFNHYRKRGWIYRGKRIVNWCPRCQTNISDLEVEYKEEKGKLWYIKYPLKPVTYNLKPETFIVVATTRPETMLGDAAVAVNPKDKRYKNLIGKKVILPIQEREIPVIADNLVDQKFGTGALKVTPAHDYLDFEIAQKHQLPSYQVIGEEGKMTKEAGALEGLSTKECRKKLLEILKVQGLLGKEETHWLNLGICGRCQTVVEPLISEQWFLSMKDLTNLAVRAARENKIRFIPPGRKKIFIDWFKNIKDWNISRQLWWGHPLPIWYCQNSEQRIKKTTSKMGFAGDVVSQVFDNKTRTYRLRNHNLKIRDRVAFENSVTKEIFGTATVIEVKKTTVGKINLKDKKHWKTYNKLEELIAAFKRHYPEKKVNVNTLVWIYTYKFEPTCLPIVSDKSAPKKCSICGGKLRKETDVLDTWFSSALWPFATLGWPIACAQNQKLYCKPKKDSDLAKFYPTNLISSAREIFFLWIGRMVFSGLEFMKKVPFKIIYIHPTILDKKGRKMSKSLGNVVDPIELIEKYGTDATRFGLTWQTTGTQDIHWSEETLLTGKKFCNKIWNASRFVLGQIGNSKFLPPTVPTSSGLGRGEIQNLTSADKRILNALSKTIKTFNKDLENFRFAQSLQTLYHFFWHQFCDIYIEKSKSQKEREITQKILLYVLLTSLKLLHPFLPFITEEIYQRLPIKNKKRCLMIEKWPE
ncbi:MAG: class I tRNA ligase family protein [Patescibacteria group bacterium]|nr:class I tRNA ligase family protein [Patescibacteria group bacterium]